MTDEFTEETTSDPGDDVGDDSRAGTGEETTETATDARVGLPLDVESMAQAARRIVWAPRTRIAVASLALVAMMFLFVFPTRSYLAQKRQIGKAAHAVEVLEAQNEVLARQASRLKTRSEIERLAREQFNMVMPGEQAYNVVETPGSSSDTTTTTVP